MPFILGDPILGVAGSQKAAFWALAALLFGYYNILIRLPGLIAIGYDPLSRTISMETGLASRLAAAGLLSGLIWLAVLIALHT